MGTVPLSFLQDLRFAKESIEVNLQKYPCLYSKFTVY